MKNTKKILLVIIGMFITSIPIWAQDNDYQSHFNNYYETKDADFIYATINYYNENVTDEQLLNKEDIRTLYFYSGIKYSDKILYDTFRQIINDSNNARLIHVFDLIDEHNMRERIKNQEIVPSLNDYYWYMYYASSSNEYLDGIMQNIMNYNKSDNMTHWLTSQSAIWSLASNSQKYESVKKHVQNNNILSDDVKEYILITDLNKIGSDTVGYLQQQKSKGLW